MLIPAAPSISDNRPSSPGTFFKNNDISVRTMVCSLKKSNTADIRVQAINEGRGHGFRHPPARTIGAGGDQARATDSFLNPEP
jgi:hypothetical protein